MNLWSITGLIVTVVSIDHTNTENLPLQWHNRHGYDDEWSGNSGREESRRERRGRQEARERRERQDYDDPYAAYNAGFDYRQRDEIRERRREDYDEHRNRERPRRHHGDVERGESDRHEPQRDERREKHRHVAREDKKHVTGHARHEHKHKPKVDEPKPKVAAHESDSDDELVLPATDFRKPEHDRAPLPPPATRIVEQPKGKGGQDSLSDEYEYDEFHGYKY
eukprot:c4822_g1_i1.p1 GENE.c4822_g1_i1~~c4822_g1_i1.p1  ORF type:complete len:223 (+),score=27.90 c4822_g1_i1:298-966(+)